MALFGIALMFLSLLQTGCARIRLPRIDPTGNSIFLPAPNSTQFLLPGSAPTAVPAGAAADSANDNLPGVFQPAPFNQPMVGSQPMVGGQPMVSPNAAPTAISPVRPGPVSSSIEPAFQSPPVPPPCNQPVVAKKRHLIPDPNRRLNQAEAGQLIMTPSRIVAPVGSEVVVLAGICGPDGRFLKNQPLEWSMSNNSVGEFIEVGGTYHNAFNRLVPPTAKKITPTYAQGRTGLKRVTLSRGTPTPLDDIDLQEGQTFVSVASASSGTSYVTGVAPNAEGWDRRRAITVIHWVDANWGIPTPIQATAGTVTPLTTLISRADGSGVKDWTVRYSIVGGAPAEFEPSGSQTAEATTDSEGRATVQIRQPANLMEPGTTQVRVDIVRPPVFGQPELIVESGITSVTWSAPALTIRAIGPRTAEFDTAFNYRVEITNPGDQTARDVVVRTKDLDDSISYISSSPKPVEYGRQYEWRLGDIAPNANAEVIEIQLRSRKLGNVGLCFEVVSQTDGLQTQACAQTEIIEPCINLIIDGPTEAFVGQNLNYDIRVENRCDQALRNVRMEVAYDPGLSRSGANPWFVELDRDGILQVNDGATLPFSAVAQGTGEQCLVVTVTADGVRPERKRYCVNVEPADGSRPIPPAGPVGQGNLLLDAAAGNPRVLRDQDDIPLPLTPVTIQISNRGNTPIENANLTLRPSDALKLSFFPGDIPLRFAGQEAIAALPTIPAGQTLTVKSEFLGLRDDNNATVELSVSNESGQGDAKTITVPAATLNGAGGLAAPPNLNEPPIGIPDGNGGLGNNDGGTAAPTPAPEDVGDRSSNPIDVRVEAFSAQVRRNTQTMFNYSVTNKTASPLTNVEIDLLIPDTLDYGETETAPNSLDLMVLPGDRFPLIGAIQPGQTFQGSIQLRAIGNPGPATFEVQVKSREFPNEFTDRATVEIVN